MFGHFTTLRIKGLTGTSSTDVIQCLHFWLRAHIVFGDEPKNLIKPSISGILHHKRIIKDSQQTVYVVKE